MTTSSSLLPLGDDLLGRGEHWQRYDLVAQHLHLLGGGLWPAIVGALGRNRTRYGTSPAL